MEVVVFIEPEDGEIFSRGPFPCGAAGSSREQPVIVRNVASMQ